MHSKSSVEIADRMSRRRAVGVAIAAAVFVAVQIARPFFLRAGATDTHVQTWMWGVNSIALLLLLATGGGLVHNRHLTALVRDEVSRSHYRSAVAIGYWTAMATAMCLYVLASYRTVTGREAVYFVVSISVAAALFAFSFLELRAHHGD